MQIEEKLEKIEKELQSLKMLVMFGDVLVEKKPISLRGMCKILVSEKELEKSIETAKKSLFSAYALRDRYPSLYLVSRRKTAIQMKFSLLEKGESIIFVPTVVLAECLYLIETKKIDLNFNELLRKIEICSNFVGIF